MCSFWKESRLNVITRLHESVTTVRPFCKSPKLTSWTLRLGRSSFATGLAGSTMKVGVGHIQLSTLRSFIRSMVESIPFHPYFLTQFSWAWVFTVLLSFPVLIAYLSSSISHSFVAQRLGRVLRLAPHITLRLKLWPKFMEFATPL